MDAVRYVADDHIETAAMVNVETTATDVFVITKEPFLDNDVRKPVTAAATASDVGNKEK